MLLLKQDLWVHPEAMWIQPTASFARCSICVAGQQCPTCMWYMPAIKSRHVSPAVLSLRGLDQLQSMRSLVIDCHIWRL